MYKVLFWAVGPDQSRIGKEIGVDPEVILATSHGRRSIDVLQMYEPKLANWECESSSTYACATVTDHQCQTSAKLKAGYQSNMARTL
jgi:hypothetical protein